MTQAAALRYALAPACIAAAVLLHLSPAGPFLHPTGLFLIAVVAAAWFGGAGPGFVAAVLATFALPQLIPMSYPLVAGFFDLPRFVTFGVTGLAVGWGATRSKRAEAALRQSERELRAARGDLEAKVVERTRALQISEERYAVATTASEEGFWDWDVASDDFYVSPRMLEMYGFPPGTVFTSRAEFLARFPFHPEDRPKWEQAVAAHFAGKTARFDIEIRLLRGGETSWYHLTGLATRDAAGKVGRWTGASKDVTARKRAEALLAGERQVLELIAKGDAQDAVLDAICRVFDDLMPSLRSSVSVLDGRSERLRLAAAPNLPAAFAERMTDLPLAGPDSGLCGLAVRRAEPVFAHDLAADPAWARFHELYAAHGLAACWSVPFMSRGGRPLGTFAVFSPQPRSPAAHELGIIEQLGHLASIAIERARTEEELKHSEERYARAMEAADDGLWEWNPATDEIFVSPRARQLFGIAEGAQIRTRADVHAHGGFHPEDRSRIEKTIQACLSRQSGGLEIEYRVIAPSGEVRWIRSQGKVFPNAKGQPALLTGSLTDITERKRDEIALAESEARFRSLSELSTDFYWETDDAHRYTSIELGKGYRGVRNIPLKLGKARWDIPYVSPGEAAWAAHRAAIAARERFVGFGFSRIEDGEERFYEHSGEPRFDAQGTFLGYRGIGRDVTSRKQAEEALRLSEERYALAMQASGEGHWDWKIPSDEFYASPRWREIAGFAQDETFKGRADALARYPFHPDDRPKYEAALAAYFAGTTKRFEIELRIRPHGELRWAKFIAICLRDSNGTPVRLTGSISDITEKRNAEQALRVSEERYARAMEGSDAGHWDWNIVTDEMFVSQRAREMLALPAGTLPARRSEIMALVPQHPDDQERMDEQVRSGIRSASHERDYRVIPGPGQVRWLRSRGKVYKDARGAAVRMTGSLTDITERRLAAEALRLSEERYALALEASAEGHFDTNLDTDELFVSERLNEIYGFAPHTQFTSRSEYLAHAQFHPDDLVVYRSAIKAAEAQGGPERYEFEYRIVRPSGEVRWLSTRGKVTRDAEGRALRRTGVVTDITKRKLAAEELRESEARFRALTELSSDWYWRQDENLRFTYVSQQITDTTPYPREWVIGKTRWELRGITLLSSSWAEHQAVLAARQPFRDFEYARVGRDGRTEYVSVSGAPIFDAQGRFKGYQGIGRSITERKRIEEELRSRQEMLDLAQKSARATAFEWRIGANGEGQNRWSPDLEAMYGLAPGTYDGSFETWKKLVHRDDWPAVRQAVKHAQRTGDVAAEYRVVHPDGSVHWLNAKGRMFFDREGKPGRMVGFMHDVTERRQAEEELKRLERQLRQAQRLEAMGTLAGGIAHDFNNILGAILGYGEMALRDAAKGSRLRRDLDSIITAGERGRSLVDRVLAFSRSGVGERVAVHVEKVVREALDLLSARLPPNVTLHAKLHAGAAAMLGDATQVHQVLMNLATNAIQAMPSGGTLRVSLDTVRIDAARAPTIGTLAPAEYLVLQVADTGTGIAPEIVDKIFDPFFTTKEVGTGTGLGLSLVHGIVAEVGGAIDVASTPGAGSTFTVYLPRSGDAPESFQKEEPELPRGDGQRVLVVDDEEPLVRLATRTLEELGYAPTGFTSSAAALAAFRADPQRFDAVITDERMPGMSGSALIREVRGIRDGIPVVLMSGFVGGAVASRAREAGAEEVLKKPLSARDLATSLARVLQA